MNESGIGRKYRFVGGIFGINRMVSAYTWSSKRNQAAGFGLPAVVWTGGGQ